jgi:hypothetical protein
MTFPLHESYRSSRRCAHAIHSVSNVISLLCPGALTEFSCDKIDCFH